MRLLFALAALLLPSTALGQAIVPQQVGTVAEVAIRTPTFQNTEAAGGTSYWQHEITGYSGSEMLRLHFSKVEIPAGSGVQLVIQDRSGVVAESLGGSGAVSLSDHWSLPIRGDYALVALVGSTAPAGVAVEIDAVAAASP